MLYLVTVLTLLEAHEDGLYLQVAEKEVDLLILQEQSIQHCFAGSDLKLCR